MNATRMLRPLVAALLTGTLALVMGCGAERPPLDATWGTSVRMALENQKLDPTLGGDRPVAGLDGAFAKNSMEAYRKSSEADPQTGRAKEPRLDAILMVKEAKQ